MLDFVWHALTVRVAGGAVIESDHIAVVLKTFFSPF